MPSLCGSCRHHTKGVLNEVTSGIWYMATEIFSMLVILNTLAELVNRECHVLLREVSLDYLRQSNKNANISYFIPCKGGKKWKQGVRKHSNYHKTSQGPPLATQGRASGKEKFNPTLVGKPASFTTNYNTKAWCLYN